jgi:FkbM family methyltransferase
MSVGMNRVIPAHHLGIAYGEHTLRRLFAMLDVDMVFDVGGNVGQYGLQLRDRVGYRGPILSFEPIPHAAVQLRALAQADGRWLVSTCAIDDRRGRARFNVMVGSQFSSLMVPSKQFEGRFDGQHAIQNVIDVEVITLGDAVRAVPGFTRGLLKLDTQGNELRILHGGVESLTPFSAIQLEVGFQALYEGADNFREALDSLEGWGYRLCALFPNNEGHFPHLLEMDAVFLRKELFPQLP